MGAMQINSGNLFVPHSLGKVSVSYEDSNFFVTNEKGVCKKVERAFVSKELRGLSGETLEKRLEVAYLALNKVGESYGVTLNYRLLGGGPILAAYGYWATKTICYGTLVGAGTAGVVATGGAVLGAGGAATAAAAASLGTASLGTGVGTVAAIATSSAAATEVATAAAVVGVGAAAGFGGVVVAVETASLAVGAVLAAVPWL